MTSRTMLGTAILLSCIASGCGPSDGPGSVADAGLDGSAPTVDAGGGDGSPGLDAGAPMPPPDGTGMPCERNADCPEGVCLPLADGRNVCTRACSTEADCVPGWSCGPIGGVDGHVCQCNPMPEVCNGSDDDCNGLVDDGEEPDGVTPVGCADGEVCSGGACVCPATSCSGACVDIRTDGSNCGACGIACTAGRECIDGECTCLGTVCGELCVDLLLNPEHCGACGSACGLGASCLEGRCADIATGAHHTCALLADQVSCWGANDQGQLGDGSTSESGRPSPVAVPDLPGAAALTAGRQHTCALLEDATVRCWGVNDSGELGDGTSVVRRLAPVQVVVLADGFTGPTTPLTGVVGIVAGSEHTCALLDDRTVRCWGENGWGQLGDGTLTDRHVAVQVPGLGGVLDMATGNGHSCVLLDDGTVRCWGDNHVGQLGDGTRTDRRMPVEAAGVSGATQIAAGLFHTCVLLDVGTVRCWGQYARRETTELTEPTSVAGGRYHTYALLADGTVWSWGRNDYGQLGDGTTAYRATPVQVLTVASTVTVSSTLFHACALAEDTTVRCWGLNDFGQVGEAAVTDQVPTPVEVDFP